MKTDEIRFIVYSFCSIACAGSVIAFCAPLLLLLVQNPNEAIINFPWWRLIISAVLLFGVHYFMALSGSAKLRAWGSNKK